MKILLGTITRKGGNPTHQSMAPNLRTSSIQFLLGRTDFDTGQKAEVKKIMTGLTLLRAYENHWFPLMKTAIKPLFLGQKLCGWRHPPQQNSPQSFAFWETIYFPFGTPEAHSQWLDFLLGKFLIEVGTQKQPSPSLRILTPPKVAILRT